MFSRTLFAESTIEMIVFGIMFAVLLTAYRISLNHIDKRNIRTAALRKGWRSISIKWSPLEAGAMFENGERSYKVTFNDQDGKICSRSCKTGILTGVFWRDR